MWLQWDTSLATPNDKGVTPRAELLRAAEKPGVSHFKQKALRELTPPCEYPEELAYLETIAREVRASCLTEMGGVSGINQEVRAYQQNRGIALLPYEVDGVVACVFAMHPPRKRQPTEPDEPVRPTPKRRAR